MLFKFSRKIGIQNTLVRKNYEKEFKLTAVVNYWLFMWVKLSERFISVKRHYLLHWKPGTRDDFIMEPPFVRVLFDD